jgi:hypothetical protein
VLGLWIGLISGVMLGLFFKLVQQATGSGVYTLLLNVDFLPLSSWLGLPALPEWLEFCLHLIVSLLIGVLYVQLIRRGRSPQLWGWLLGLLPSLLWIPLTQLSDRVPAWDELAALLWWLAGHLLYSIILIILAYSMVAKRN